MSAVLPGGARSNDRTPPEIASACRTATLSVGWTRELHIWERVVRVGDR